MSTRYELGQSVALRADPSRVGPIIKILPTVGDMRRYRIYHAATDIRDYSEDQIVPAREFSASEAMVDAILSGTSLGADVFRARLTAARLSHPLTDNLYALHAARIQFIPFQFKPLLRLLKADQPRLLIADEVGVGKTIEAGLILRELETRQRMGNVLIVCPKALVFKWQEEMRRFDEQFEPLTAQTLRYVIHETQLEGRWPSKYSRAIVNLELLRQDEYLKGTDGRYCRPGLLTLDEPPKFDLVIVDEAHHLRNPETSSHELARFLCDTAETVVFLSATPMHLGSQNLFALLNLLRDDLFPDIAVFNEIIEPNRYLTESMRQVRNRMRNEDWQEQAADNLRYALGTSWGRRVLGRDPKYTHWLNRLGNGQPLDNDSRIRCLRDIEEFHTLAHVMNRTRRRDIGRFTIRDPHTVSVPFTPEQQTFYSKLMEFRKEVLELSHDPLVVRLIMDTLDRQAASCLPALLPALDSFLRTGRFRVHEVTDDMDSDVEEVELPDDLVSRAKELRSLATNLPANDPKLDNLREVVHSSLSTDGPRKVLVFSYFLHTLRYLERALNADGVRVGLVTGAVKDHDRQILRDRFRMHWSDPDAIDILLSSEVGCEGLDYEFCDRMVNYDIPWNPMRVEQRIGRIDRFGQKSEKVIIFNFITPGTVEERIFHRCYERLNIFRETIGDLEEPLGELVQELTRIAMDPRLSPAQAEEKANQMLDNSIRLVEERRRMEDEGRQLIGFDERYTGEIESLVSDGRFVSGPELCHMVGIYVEMPSFGGRLLPDPRQPQIYRLRVGKEGRSALLSQVNSLRIQGRQAQSFKRWLEGSDSELAMTFDQATALDNRDITFVTPIHPMASAAIDGLTTAPGLLTTRVRVVDDRLEPGTYLFACDLWESVAVRPEIRLVGIAWDFDRKRISDEVSAALISTLGNANELSESLHCTSPDLRAAFQEIDEALNSRRLEEVSRLCEDNKYLLDRKSASLESHFAARIARIRNELDNSSDERIRRMKTAELRRVENDFEEKRNELNRRRDADIVMQRLALGILVVSGGSADA